MPDPIADLPAAFTPPVGQRVLPPFEAGQQGIAGTEASDADRLTGALLGQPGIGVVATWRADDGVYEARSAKGDVQFVRTVDDDGGLHYPIVRQSGENPLANTDFTAMPTLGDEDAAAGGVDLPVPEDHTTLPDPYRRISQLFDSERAPDLVYSISPGDDPNEPGGTHGNLDLVETRAPLIMAGPGIAGGTTSDAVVQAEDVAPTIAEALGVQRVTGRGSDGQLHPGQLLKWQDGTSLAPSLGAQQAERAVMFVLDGMNQAVLYDAMDKGLVPNISRIAGMGTTFRYGQMADFPTVTWVNHHVLTTGAEPGHTAIVGNMWLDRGTNTAHGTGDATITTARAGQVASDGAAVADDPYAGAPGAPGVLYEAPGLSAKGSVRTAKYLSPNVETLYEAVARSFPGATTASMLDPSGRGATVAPLELRGLSKMASLGFVKNFADGWRNLADPARKAIKANRTVELQDTTAYALGKTLLESRQPPKLSVFELESTDHQGHLTGPQSPEEIAALQESDRRIGSILATLDARGMTDSTMFVVTADHGMEAEDRPPAAGVAAAVQGTGLTVLNAAPFLYLLPAGSPQPRSAAM